MTLADLAQALAYFGVFMLGLGLGKLTAARNIQRAGEP